MTILKRFRRQKRAWDGILTAGVFLFALQQAQAQEQLYPPPEPQPVGIRLTPLEQIQSLEKGLMLAVAANKPDAAKASAGEKPSQSTVEPVDQPNPALADTAEPASGELQKHDANQPAAPLPASTHSSANSLPSLETLPLKPQTPMPVVKGSTFGPVANFMHRHAKPASYSPLEAIVIFPVLKHGREKAFGDLPIVFSREMALRLESVVPKTRVYNPVYTVDELRVRGLGHVYEQIMGYYLRAGRPEPKATDYMLKQLALTDGKAISRVIFIEADLDTNHPAQQSGLFERLNGWLTDSTIKQMKYFINSRIQVFDAENPSFPMVWGGSWRRSLKTSQFVNITPSVFSDSDSQQAFSALSREMSREILWFAPKEAYMSPQFDLSVQGKLASQKEALFSEPEEVPAGNSPMSEMNRQAIQRVLQRQGRP